VKRPHSLPLLPALLFVVLFTAHEGWAVPVLRWDFGAEETSPLESHGGVHRDTPGPRPPAFPDFDGNNTAVGLDGNGAYFSFPDPGSGSPLDFTNGEAITVEAWVNPSSIGAHEIVAVVGKGRTGGRQFARDNQNWALRLREKGGKVCVGFLFATPQRPEQAATDAHWHRWTAFEGFVPGSGWHHVAVSYLFGEPSSVRGWLDGRPLEGSWDMGGKTTEAPVVDDDALWIGSSNGAAPANSFRGLIDAVAIHRETLGADVLSKRFNRVGGPVAAKPAVEVMPELGAIPAGLVRASFHQKAPDPSRWLNEGEQWPAETLHWETPRFLLPRLPLRYESWGIRDAWQGPVLVRLAADVVLAPGKRRFLVRTRALSRLWINGSVVARTASKLGAPRDGEEDVHPVPQPLLPGMRLPSYEQVEAFGDAEIPPDGRCRIVLETLVGAGKKRSETGEICVAVQSADGRSFDILSPVNGAAPLAFTDAAVEPELARIVTALEDCDTRNRHAGARSQDAFWQGRHDAARQWAAAHPAPPVPAGAPHPVDAFLNAKARAAVDASSHTPPDEARLFQTKVLSVLRDECFRCHGDKDKGGLRLNNREAVLRGGDSGSPAVVPGVPAASALIARIRSRDEDERMPPKGEGLKPEQAAALESWVKAGAPWPAHPVAESDVAPAPSLTDAAFLRRLTLDLAGVPPSPDELAAFLADARDDKRERAVDRLLADKRWADAWMPYWMDVLAENPTLINPSLNTTGPFRWFLLETLRDNKPLDRFVTELVMLRGSPHTGGSAGFGIAGENDAPMASKAQILASAFLGIELQCARCHDSPYHSTKQADLYALASMLERKPVSVPKSSSVPAAFFEKKARESLIKVTLKPGEPVGPQWPFARVTGSEAGALLERFLEKPTDTREQLAALLTGPQNTRFAQVLVNRVWRRFMGAGFVEPVADWEGRSASHPELLQWLAHDFVVHGYDLKHLTRRILTSEAYQREAVGANLAAGPEVRFFNAPERRRLTAEQVVDALHAAAGRPMETEEITFDPTGRTAEGARISLGRPIRAWMLANLTNDRDRPSLSLPYAQRVVDVLEAFGWNGARQSARTDRESAPSVLQPGVLANGTLSSVLTRASHQSALATLALESPSPEALVRAVFVRFLSRLPSSVEMAAFAGPLSEGFSSRIVPASAASAAPLQSALRRVTWFNHLHPDSTPIALENEKRARSGPAPDPRLSPEWRERFEDFVWSLVNTREFVWMP